MTNLDYLIALLILSLLLNAITLLRFVLFKRKLILLKADIKKYVEKNGVTIVVWDLFNNRTKKMLKFWS